MMTRVLPVVLLLLIPLCTALWAVEERDIEVISNPHGDSCGMGGRRLDSLLEPYHLITQPIATQADTFQELLYKKVMSVPIPVYRMKQPERLSEAQLQFQLVLVRDLATAGKAKIYETPVEHDRAVDSWFPGYYWTPLVMYCGGEELWQHVGWKFTSIDGSKDLKEFYALIVDINDDDKTKAAVRIGGFKAPGWMVAKVIT
jgi:hypothetical protein